MIVEHPTVPKRVVDHHQAAGVHQAEYRFEVPLGVCLIDIYKHDIEALAGCGQILEHLDGFPPSDVDPVGDPAACQFRRAISAHSSERSIVTTCPSAPTDSANAKAERPLNVPISRARAQPRIRVRKPNSGYCSLANIMAADSPSAAVTEARAAPAEV